MSNVAQLDATTRELLRQAISEARKERLPIVPRYTRERRTTCAVCGARFESHSMASHQKYCSRACNAKAHYERRKDRLATDPELRERYAENNRRRQRGWRQRRKVEREHISCVNCGTRFQPHKNAPMSVRSCSKRCKDRQRYLRKKEAA